jgi:hypothetical protein
MLYIGIDQGESSMAATSVTGRGLGSADKRQKGSEHVRLGAEKLIGPRPVACGTVTLSGGGTATVILPALDTTYSYVVLANDTYTGSANAVGASITVNAGVDTVLTFKGTGSHTVNYGVFKFGLAV